VSSPFPKVVASRPHFANEHVQVWLLEPLGMATRILGPVHVTRPMIEIITDAATQALRRLNDRAPARMRFMHDWRGVTGYDPAARQAVLSWGLDLGVRRVARIDVLFEPTQSKLLAMGIASAQAAFSAFGIEFVTYRSPDGLLAAGGCRAEARARIEPPGPAQRRSTTPSKGMIAGGSVSPEARGMTGETVIPTRRPTPFAR
jgi:hypothetical protein